MRMVLCLVPIVLGLTACQTSNRNASAPGPYPGPSAARPGMVIALERTRWEVTHINGQAVPPKGNYRVDFDSGRIAAKFGCNVFGGPYSQSGTTLNANALVSTRISCFNMAFETQASAILGQPMTIAVVGRNQINLSNAAGTIVLVRR